MALSFVNLQDRTMALGNYGEADRTNIKTFINVAYFDVAKRRRWNWLQASTSITTSAGTPTVAVPTTVQAHAFGRLRPTDVNTDEPDFLEDYADFDRRTRESLDTLSTSQSPSCVSILNNSFYFYPTPAVA